MGIELFERVAEVGAPLLKVDLRPEKQDASRLSALLLTFDVGRLLVRPDPRREELSIDVVVAGAPPPAGLVDGLEEEPWWRLLGSPVARVWTVEGGLRGGVCLQFRADDDAPRIVTLEAQGASLAVRLENPPE
jgi:hypothetical protein